jgi:hypothetical protein
MNSITNARLNVVWWTTPSLNEIAMLSWLGS